MFPSLISAEGHKQVAAVPPRSRSIDIMLCNNRLSSHVGDFGHLAELGHPLSGEEHRIGFSRSRAVLHAQNSPWPSIS